MRARIFVSHSSREARGSVLHPRTREMIVAGLRDSYLALPWATERSFELPIDDAVDRIVVFPSESFGVVRYG